jgi:hypothetical protein
MATLQYQLQLQWRHFLNLRLLQLHDKIWWEDRQSKNEWLNDYWLRKMRGVFDGTDNIKWEHHQYKNDATTFLRKNMQTI